MMIGSRVIQTSLGKCAHRCKASNRRYMMTVVATSRSAAFSDPTAQSKQAGARLRAMIAGKAKVGKNTIFRSRVSRRLAICVVKKR